MTVLLKFLYLYHLTNWCDVTIVTVRIIKQIIYQFLYCQQKHMQRTNHSSVSRKNWPILSSKIETLPLQPSKLADYKNHPMAKQCSSGHKPSPVMPLHHICKAIHVLSPVHFIPSLYYPFLIWRIFLYFSPSFLLHIGTNYWVGL